MPGEDRQENALETPAFRARLRQRETEAWEAAYEAYGLRMRRIAYRILPDAFDPDAAAQQSWVQAIHRVRRLDVDGATGAWLASICVNLCMTVLRREGRRRALLRDRTKIPSTPHRSFGQIPGHTAGGSRVREGVRQLSRDQQQIIYLRFACEMQAPEIGLALGVPEGTVRKRLSRAYARLRRHLGDDDLESLTSP